jgi:hypothetical protein
MNVACHDLGPQQLKNIVQPNRVYRIEVDEPLGNPQRIEKRFVTSVGKD